MSTTTALPFVPLDLAITGTNLIEASAGTGKTYGIASLFTRLVVLEQMPVDSILVVTFTNAATAELKTRLRARLDQVLQALEKTENPQNDTELAAHCTDDFILKLIRKALANESHARLILRLKAAISQFDNAAIYTIHGFCQRVLRDYAFWCQVPFDIELNEQPHTHLLTAAQDFWRQHIAHSATLAPLVFKQQQSPQNMLATLSPFLGRPYLSTRLPENHLSDSQQNLAALWQTVSTQLDTLETLFWQVHPQLNGKSYNTNSYQKVFAHLKTAAAAGRLPEQDKLATFSLENLSNKTKKGGESDHPAYTQLAILAKLNQAIENVEQAETAALVRLYIDLLDYLKQYNQQQKKSRHERSFDDLLLDLYQALSDTNPHHAALSAAIAQTWQVALIDEFQDTDPLQYAIFRNSFIRHGKPLFLVGDSKQAIYSFRGADIHAYLQAAADADHHYTLDTNYRSHATLIKSIGHIFKQKKRPFILDHIHYADVSASRSHTRLNPPQTALQVRWLNRSEEDTNKESLRRHAAECCADEIAAILQRAAQGCLSLSERAVRAGDIAVLVRTHNEGLLISQALKTHRIQSVLILRESVFKSAEADAIAALLAFWLQPQRSETLRYVLSSVLFNQTAADLAALHHNEHALLDWIAAAERALTDWQQHGIYAAIQRFAADHNIETRLLAGQNERSLTNFHQIIELLANEDEQSHIPSSLHQWLLNQIQAAHNGDMAESNILRLESDEALVKIVTMHTAKGLQYPLVYCPFAWDAPDVRTNKNKWHILHRNADQAELLATSQLNDTDSEQLADEELGERLRLLYVALTRAEEQLTVYAAYHGNSHRNPFAHLLEGLPENTRQHTEAAYAESKNKGKAPAEMAHLQRNWQRLADAAPQDTDIAFHAHTVPLSPTSQEVYPAPVSGSSAPYQAIEPPPRSFQIIRHTSFTGLSRHTLTAEETEPLPLQPTLDAAENLTPAGLTVDTAHEYDIYHFPRGANAGVCLHEILENFDFSQSAESQSQPTVQTLQRYGFGAEWLAAVNNMLEHCRRQPLHNTISLSDLPANQRLPEMAFMLHTEGFRLADVQNWFTQTQPPLPDNIRHAAQRLNFQDLQGYLNGFIDLTCQDQHGHVFVIDYKSNHLGNHAEAYNQAAMDEAVAEHHYYLQALIYAVAVARYYRARQHPLPAVHIRYWFLRGLNGNSSNGVWAWDITAAELARWL